MLEITAEVINKSETYLTAEDLFLLSGKGRYELVKGEIREMTPSGLEHGLITSRLHYLLYTEKAGHLIAAETGFKIFTEPDTVRAPDIAFIKKEKLDKKIVKGYSSVIPDLVVEVISPSDIYLDVEEKIADWISAGVPLVWVVNPM